MVISSFVWSTLLGRLLKKFGWLIALIVFLLLVVGTIIAIIYRSNEQFLSSSELEVVIKQEVANNLKEEKAEGKLFQNMTTGSKKNNPEVEPSIKLKSSIASKSIETEFKTETLVERENTGQLKTFSQSEASLKNSSLKAKTQLSLIPGDSNAILTVPEQLIELQPLTTDDKNFSSELQKKEKNRSVSNNLNLNPLVAIDIMRVDEEGEALVAGRTEPNVTVEVLADEVIIGVTKADNNGEFVVVGVVEESSSSQTITVRSSSSENIGLDEKQDSVLSQSENIDKKQEKEVNSSQQWSISEDVFVILPVSIKTKTNLKSALKKAPLIVQSSSDEIKIIQHNDIAPVDGIIIDSISYSDFGEAVLVGRANPRNNIRVYLDNILTIYSTVGKSGGWYTELTGLEPGIYELRIDEVDDNGIVKSRISTPFKKESKDFLMNMVSGSITVQTGNSLWRIARRIFGKGIRYIEIYKKNNDLIKDPNLIYPGQVFSIPTKS